jgi:hypothetical protein
MRGSINVNWGLIFARRVNSRLRAFYRRLPPILPVLSRILPLLRDAPTSDSPQKGWGRARVTGRVER